MYGEGPNSDNPAQYQNNNNSAPAAGNPNNAQKHASSLNSGYPGTQSRAQQMNDGTYTPNQGLAGCTTNLKTFAVVSVALIVIGFIMSFLVDNPSNSMFTLGVLLLVTGLIMLFCMFCNMFGFVPCFFCLCGPPLWVPLGGPIFYSRRNYYGAGPGPGNAPPPNGGGGGGYPAQGGTGGNGGGYPGRV